MLLHKWRMIPHLLLNLSIVPFTNAGEGENASLQSICFQLDLFRLIAWEDFTILIWHLQYFLLIDFLFFVLLFCYFLRFDLK